MCRIRVVLEERSCPFSVVCLIRHIPECLPKTALQEVLSRGLFKRGVLGTGLNKTGADKRTRCEFGEKVLHIRKA